MEDSPTTDGSDAPTANHSNASDSQPDRTAVVVARDAAERPDTEEIRRLADAADYRVVDELTQRRREDGTYNVGHGKATELARRVMATDAGTVLFDNELTPGQYRNLVALLPDGTVVIDRHRLVLNIFAQGTGGKAARLQVELAKLRYQLPRVRETEERTHMQRAAETGSRLVDIEKRIRTVERKLDRVTDRAAARRADRREEGFGLVAIAGYTNAGKSTLLHRLADDLAVEELHPGHADLDGEAEVADRLFKTLETTTRRATLDGRPVLLTDTVGLVDGLPHDLVASFSATLDAVADSDAGLLVVDASDPLDTLREKLRVSIAELNDPRGKLVAVLNKTDLLSAEETAEHQAAVAEQSGIHAVVPVSAIEGTGIDRLRSVVSGTLPSRRAQFALPNDGETQSFIAWVHDHGQVETAYEGDSVRVRFEASPEVVQRAVSRAESLQNRN
ncbi:MAG: GTPase HflX [Halolamina sp.]